MQDLDNLSNNLSKIKANVSKQSNTLLEIIANEFIVESEFSFENQKSPFGGAWKSLAKSTLKRKKGRLKLVETSTLNRSLSYKIQKNQAIISSSLPYAPIHQFGGKAGKKGSVNIAKREYMPINARGILANEFNTHVDKLLEKLGDNLLKDFK